jgi:hypothetical protein
VISLRITENVTCGVCQEPATLYEDIVPVQRGWLSETRAAWWEHDNGKQCDPGDGPVNVFIDHITNCLPPFDAAIVAHTGQIEESDLPEEWVLTHTEIVGGKRVRIYNTTGEIHEQ